MKRKDVQRLARELVDEIDLMRQQMAQQDAIIQRQATRIKDLERLIAVTSPLLSGPQAIPEQSTTSRAPVSSRTKPEPVPQTRN